MRTAGDRGVTGCTRQKEDSGGGWLTYAEAGDRLGVSSEAVRAKAARKRWRRQIGNDGLLGDQHPAGDLPVTAQAHEPGDRPVTPRSSPGRKPVGAATIKALSAHVETMKQQLAAAEARAEKLAAELTDRDGALASERAKVEAERTKADKAIAEFAALADALTRIAAERVRPWWRQLVG